MDSIGIHWVKFFLFIIHKTPKRLHGLENITRAYIQKVVGSKWVKKFNFG